MGEAVLGKLAVGDTAIEIITLHPSEMELLRVLRGTLRFGEVVIKMRDGLPVRLVRTQEYVNLKPQDS